MPPSQRTTRPLATARRRPLCRAASGPDTASVPSSPAPSSGLSSAWLRRESSYDGNPEGQRAGVERQRVDCEALCALGAGRALSTSRTTTVRRAAGTSGGAYEQTLTAVEEGSSTPSSPGTTRLHRSPPSGRALERAGGGRTPLAARAAVSAERPESRRFGDILRWRSPGEAGRFTLRPRLAFGVDCRCGVPEAEQRLHRFVTWRCRSRDPSACPHRRCVSLPRHEQHSAREGACRKRPKRADHDSFAEPITARTYGARSCGMRVVPSADGASGSTEPETVEKLAGRMRAIGAGARSLCPRWLSLSGAAFAGG